VLEVGVYGVGDESMDCGAEAAERGMRQEFRLLLTLSQHSNLGPRGSATTARS
jgi:hypothetical protein